MDSHVEIFKTNQPHEIMLIQNTLRELGIPHFGQEQSVTGLRGAMPQTPTPAPGVAWAILVPFVASEDAKQAINDLGIKQSTESEVWSDGPADAAPSLKYVYIIILVVFIILTVKEIL